MRLQIAEVAEASPELELRLKATEVRADAMQKERERLMRELDELGAVQRQTERERLKLAEIAARTETVQKDLEKSRADKDALDGRFQQERNAHAQTRAALELEKGKFAEGLAKAASKANVEAKMLRELSERQEGELKELRVKWARASTELNRLQLAHAELMESEKESRVELGKLKSGQGILAASDLVDAMGLDLTKVKKLEARVKELEGQLTKK